MSSSDLSQTWIPPQENTTLYVTRLRFLRRQQGVCPFPVLLGGQEGMRAKPQEALHHPAASLHVLWASPQGWLSGAPLQARTQGELHGCLAQCITSSGVTMSPEALGQISSPVCPSLHLLALSLDSSINRRRCSLWPSSLFPTVFRVLSSNRECAASVWPQCWEITLTVYSCDCDLFESTDGSWRAPSWRLPGSAEKEEAGVLWGRI